ncbi:flavodoxin [Alkalibaculum sp. M08DMB]|uniref:Flavodoxin n=1 Tax=Alkalibaculum sporogenes TaxID=2655001 RepID=A0A6A7K4M5_9FIRM|nr:flavodoxin family protein [Alkalibaculum sporogenes]MPW24264.1 flavodoxin [Alkalibaculum sporogenes]
MKILITYSSMTGNTREIAECIHSTLPESILLPMKKVKNIKEWDFVFMGFWVNKGNPNKEAIKFLSANKHNKVALFATLGAIPGGEHTRSCIEGAKEILGESCHVVDFFVCQGKIDPMITKVFKIFPKGHYHHFTDEKRKLYEKSIAHPDEIDKEKARQWGMYVREQLELERKAN